MTVPAILYMYPTIQVIKAPIISKFQIKSYAKDSAFYKRIFVICNYNQTSYYESLHQFQANMQFS